MEVGVPVIIGHLFGFLLGHSLLLLNQMWNIGVICEAGNFSRTIWSYIPKGGSMQPSFSWVFPEAQPNYLFLWEA